MGGFVCIHSLYRLNSHLPIIISTALNLGASGPVGGDMFFQDGMFEGS